MPQPQNSFLQSVFNEISLERDLKLWQSGNDKLSEKRIRFLSEFEETRFETQLGKERTQVKKNETLCKAFKAKGDAALESGDYEKSVALFNAALCLAPDKSDLTASIFEARANAFKESKKFEEALEDLTEAEEQTGNREKFRNIKVELFSKLNSTSLNLAENFRKALEENDLQISRQLESSLIIKSSEDIAREKITNVNPNYKSFSESVLVEETPLQGRYTVAGRDIKAGELLAVDQPVVTYLDAQFSKTHCWNCLTSTTNGRILPCSGCSGVIFCSRHCRDKAEGSYHRYECGIIDILYQSDVGVWILGFRAVASRPREYFMRNDFSKVSQRKSTVATDDEFDQLCRLVTHEGSNKFTAPELMKEALVSVFLTRCLARKDYFGSQSGSKDPFGSEECRIALWIHNLMRIARFNSHELTELIANFSSSDPKLRTRRIGVACNPNLALINHACDPNYGRVWVHSGSDRRPTIYAFATRPIAKGEEICDAYSGVFSIADKEDRAIVHQRYHFQCECVACRNDWPLLKDISGNFPKNDEKSKKLEKILKARSKIQRKAPAEQLRWSIEALTLASSVLKMPHPVFYDLEEEVHKNLWFVTHNAPPPL